MQTNKDHIRDNIKRIDHDYKVGDKFMLTNHASYKYVSIAWSHYSTAQQKLSIIYVALNHINFIQTLKILPLKNIYDDVKI